MSQCQFDALASFSYNVGAGYWNGSGDCYVRTVIMNTVVPPQVLAFFRVVAGEQAIFKAVILTHDQAGVGIGFGVFAVEFFIVQQVQQYA